MANGKHRLMGSYEIGLLLGSVSRQLVYQLTNDLTFPAPYATLKRGKIWLADDVEPWVAAYKSRKSAGRRAE
ncbi:helix-turn-helix transcriptional regulator [Actinoplanes sp. NPDC049265]|uniref:helix-turn-helix transcriptional regulator n=1 Tax=Actinoplanes sp. NPDC049265 TaxID=3363902 RepID=UPI00370FFB42